MIIQKQFLRKFTEALILSSSPMKISYKKEVINSELVPGVSEEVAKNKLLIEKKTAPIAIINNPERRTIPVQLAGSYQITSGEYGKLTGLIKDPSVTFIECPGADKEVTIMRQGRKQSTKIVLNSKELQDFLNSISEKARIPIIEGIFRAAVDNFMLDAVVSSTIGSRFIIKKQTPYSLIDSQK